MRVSVHTENKLYEESERRCYLQAIYKFLLFKPPVCGVLLWQSITFQLMYSYVHI